MIGRFTTTDAASAQPQTPVSWNRYSYVRGNPLVFIDPDGSEALDSTIATFLGGYFGRDVSRVQVYGGGFSRAVTWLLRASAVTFGQRVFYSRAGWERYQAREVEGIALTAHEVRHTLQYRDLSVPGFLLKYVWQAVKFRGNPYRMPLERIAYEDQDFITRLLEQDQQLLDSIQTGGNVRMRIAPSSSGWMPASPPSAGVFGDLAGLFGFSGTLYIDGIDVTGLFLSPR